MIIFCIASACSTVKSHINRISSFFQYERPCMRFFGTLHFIFNGSFGVYFQRTERHGILTWTWSISARMIGVASSSIRPVILAFRAAFVTGHKTSRFPVYVSGTPWIILSTQLNKTHHKHYWNCCNVVLNMILP